MNASAQNPDRPAGNKKLVQRYLTFLKPYRFTLLLILALGILQFAVPMIGPWMTKILIDDVLPQKESFWTLGKAVAVLTGSLPS